MFTDMVNVTDEALVMQVVQNYLPRWDKGEEIGDKDRSKESSEIGSKRSSGQEKGEILTCAKTASSFYEYCRKVKAVRESSFSAKWDEKLQKDNLIEMSAMQWLEMMKSMDQAEGAYFLDAIGD